MSKFIIGYASSEGLKESVQGHIILSEYSVVIPNTKNGHC